jgi:hypothetical protein
MASIGNIGVFHKKIFSLKDCNTIPIVNKVRSTGNRGVSYYYIYYYFTKTIK